jgi:carbamoyltransferase
MDMLLVADVVELQRRRLMAEEQMHFGIDKLNLVRSEIPAVTHVDWPSRMTRAQAVNGRLAASG